MSNKLNDISFTLGQGGSGRIASGSDFISALMFFNLFYLMVFGVSIFLFIGSY